MTKTCVVMQPTYLPWSGFFNLIYQSDVFIFLDDAQFSKSSWHNRNQILISGEKKWITIPVNSGLHGINFKYPISKTNWNVKHIKTILTNYSKHPYFNDLKVVLRELESVNHNSLSEINTKIIIAIASLLRLRTEFLFASELNIDGNRSERLISFCENTNSNIYLSPVGSKEYLEQDGVFDRSEIKLTYQDFSPKIYPQYGRNDFVSHLSIVDVLANLGIDKTIEYIKG